MKKEFPKVDFIEFDSVEEIKDKNLIIIDSAKGINKVTLVEDVNKLETNKIYSLHDFDLAYNLKLLKKFGMITSVKIFAIPQDLDEETAFKQLKELIKSTLF
ncbi:MAG: hypothetical protein J7K73_03155 [Nanoarchaeota archaeon]|nr:hypothetical protein [Nanoarchaeota archaeon]